MCYFSQGFMLTCDAGEFYFDDIDKAIEYGEANCPTGYNIDEVHDQVSGMFVKVETDKGEPMFINPECIIAFWGTRRDKVCVMFVNDMTQTLNCSCEELYFRLNAGSGVFANKL